MRRVSISTTASRVTTPSRVSKTISRGEPAPGDRCRQASARGSAEFGLNALHGGVDSRTLPNSQTAEEVASVMADAIGARRGGDVYTRPEAVERVVGYLRGLATGA